MQRLVLVPCELWTYSHSCEANYTVASVLSLKALFPTAAQAGVGRSI